MLPKRSKIIGYYAKNTLKSILRLRQSNNYKNKGKREPLDPRTIPKFENQLNKPYIYHPILIKGQADKNHRRDKADKEEFYYIDICELNQQILPKGFPQTCLLGFGGLVKEANKRGIRYVRSSPGGTFVVRRYIPIQIQWRNMLNSPVHMHIHGGEVPKTVSLSKNKSGDRKEFHRYINNKEAAAYWYYDQNMKNKGDFKYLGLGGFYLLEEEKEGKRFDLGQMDLPSSKYEYPIIIQDCSFYTDGSIKKKTEVSEEEYFGNAIVVNGKVWPNLDVERRQYRFYILNGSTSRFLNLILSNDISFTIIGGDRGFLPSPVRQKAILLAPGERVDVLIDFSRLATGTKIIMKNDAKTPYPFGDMPNPETTGQIMRFNIPEYEAISISPIKLPEKISEQPSLPSDLPQKIHIITEDIEAKDINLPLTIEPQLDDAEEWLFVNLTSRAYSIYLKEVKCKIINRQEMDIILFRSQYNFNEEKQSINPYLINEPIEANEYEMGWKDTVRVDSGMVTRIAMIPY